MLWLLITAVQAASYEMVDRRLKISPFTRLQEGEAIYHHLPDSAHSELINIRTSLGDFLLKLHTNADGDDDDRKGEWSLKISPVPHNAMVAVFTEGELVQWSSLQNPPGEVESIKVWRDSEIIVLAHTAATNELAQLRQDIQQKETCNKEEFIQMAKSHATPDWAMIEASVMGEGVAVMEVISKGQVQCCGGSTRFKNLTCGLWTSVSTATVFFIGFILILYFTLLHPPPEMKFQGCGVLGNGTHLCTALQDTDRHRAFQRLHDCFEGEGGVLQFFQKDVEWYEWVANFCLN